MEAQLCIPHWTHRVLLKNSGRAARETTYEYMHDYVRTHGLRLMLEYLDEEMAACLRVLPDDSQSMVAGCLQRCDPSRSLRVVVWCSAEQSDEGGRRLYRWYSCCQPDTGH